MAAGQTPNSSNIERVASGVANETSVVVHPEYMYWRRDWQKLRDVISGQREIKRKGEVYLLRFPGQTDAAYARYLERAVFYNMSAQTQTGMLGQVFRRDPIIKNLPARFKDQVVHGFAKDGAGHVNFVKTIMSEALVMGRYGVLVDVEANPTTQAQSYAVGYSAENILDWTVEDVNGRYKITRVLLREFERELRNTPNKQNPWVGQANPGSPAGRRASQQVQNAAQVQVRGAAARLVRQTSQYLEAYTYKTIYRELTLTQNENGRWVYQQFVYDEDPQTTPRETFTPNVRGQYLDFIPFMFFGASGNNADVEKPPMLDIAELNISHYRTYADLEHGRIFVALPTYYAPTADDEGAAEYHIGPDKVWEVPVGAGGTPGILEFKGQGLGSLVTALQTKEQQIAAIGGRLMAGAAKGGENSNQTMLREANEQALLLNVILAVEAGMREVTRWWMMWRDLPMPDSLGVRYTVNKAFLSSPIGARELRAIQMMYDDGLITVDIFYNYLLKAEVIEADVTLDDFTTALKDPDSFINSPNAGARQRGYESRDQELNQTSVAREADMQQQEIDLQAREVKLMEMMPQLPPKAPAASGAVPSRPTGPKPSRPSVPKNKPSKPRGA